METPAQIAKANNWFIGMRLRAREEKRRDRFYVITAIGRDTVLGVNADVVRSNEFPLALDDAFIDWQRVEQPTSGTAITYAVQALTTATIMHLEAALKRAGIPLPDEAMGRVRASLENEITIKAREITAPAAPVAAPEETK